MLLRFFFLPAQTTAHSKELRDGLAKAAESLRVGSFFVTVGVGHILPSKSWKVVGTPTVCTSWAESKSQICFVHKKIR